MMLPRIARYAILSAAMGCRPAAQAVEPPYTVDFPGGWTRAEAGGVTAVLSIPSTLDVRPSRGDAKAAEWMFRMKSVEGPFSDECYAVRGGASPQARKVTAAECERSPLVQPTVAIATGGAASGFQGFQYQGRSYATGGRVLGKALLSPSRRWLSVMSDTSAEEGGGRPNQLSALGGGEPSQGEIFVDVYDANTGIRTASARSPFKGFGPRILFGQAFWVQDGAFVMPLNLLADRCLLITPESQ